MQRILLVPHVNGGSACPSWNWGSLKRQRHRKDVPFPGVLISSSCLPSGESSLVMVRPCPSADFALCSSAHLVKTPQRCALDLPGGIPMPYLVRQRPPRPVSVASGRQRPGRGRHFALVGILEGIGDQVQQKSGRSFTACFPGCPLLPPPRLARPGGVRLPSTASFDYRGEQFSDIHGLIGISM